MNLNNITTALKTGITIYQYEQWQNTGSVNLMQKESHMLSKVWLKTNIYNPDSLDKPFIQLSATFTSESDIRYILDIENILKSYIIARYYGWEPKEEDLEEIISHTSFFDINVDDAIYEVLTMPREKITI